MSQLGDKGVLGAAAWCVAVAGGAALGLLAKRGTTDLATKRFKDFCRVHLENLQVLGPSAT